MVALCSCWCRSAIRQRDNVRHLRALGFSVTYSYEHNQAGEYIVAKDDRDMPVLPASLIDLLGEDCFFSVQSIGSPNPLPHIGDEDLRTVTQLRSVHSVSIAWSAVSDRAIEYLAELPKLRWLSLAEVSVSNNSVPILAKMKTLERLTLNRTNITRSGYERLRVLRPDVRITWFGRAKTEIGSPPLLSRLPKPAIHPRAQVIVPANHQEMVLVPSGEYTFGPYVNDQTFTRHVDAFYIDRYEVSCIRYQAFLNATGHPPPDPVLWPAGCFPAGAENLPVFGLTWDDADTFAKWEGKRLPTSDEWVAAARGGDDRAHPWGDGKQELQEFANISPRFLPGKPLLAALAPIDSYPLGVSPSGAYNMVGKRLGTQHCSTSCSEFLTVDGPQRRQPVHGSLRPPMCCVPTRFPPDKQRGSCSELITHVPDRPGHDRRYAIDATKIRTELGWQPTQSFDAGIERTVQWYIGHRQWVERIASGGYRRDRLGLKSASE